MRAHTTTRCKWSCFLSHTKSINKVFFIYRGSRIISGPYLRAGERYYAKVQSVPQTFIKIIETSRHQCVLRVIIGLIGNLERAKKRIKGEKERSLMYE